MENLLLTTLSKTELGEILRQEIENYFNSQKNVNQPDTKQPEQFLTIQEAAEFLRLTVPTVYIKVHKGELPVMKRGKRLYFSKTELMDYLKAGRKKSNAEIEQEANAYLSKIKKG